jgi:hypothetical protein
MFHGDDPRSAEEWLEEAKRLSNEHPTAAQFAATMGIGCAFVSIQNLLLIALRRSTP